MRSKIIINFFFSSRRRHTRWPRDWSSDVCSSDLLVGLVLQLDQAQELVVRPGVGIEAAVEREQFAHGQGTMEVALLQLHRSEERRVGKECRERSSRGEFEQ